MRTFRDTANDQIVRDYGLAGMLMKAFEGRFEDRRQDGARRARPSLEDWQDRRGSTLTGYRASPFGARA